jgi:hypothetical protein
MEAMLEYLNKLVQFYGGAMMFLGAMVGVAGAAGRIDQTQDGKPDRPAVADQVQSSIEPKGYVCYQARKPIQIDGRLDEDAWKMAPWTDAFVDIEGVAKPRPRFQTRAKMLWDDTYFYVAALLEEPHVWGTLTRHDSVIFHDNDFEIFIDPDGDNQEYYEIEINALNTEWDLFLKKAYRDRGPAINAWEIPGLKTAVHVSGTLNNATDTDLSWSVEFAIPWKVLGEYAHNAAPPRDGDQWRVNFSRVEWRHEIVNGRYGKVANTREDNWVWTPQGVVNMHRPERWGYVQFSTAAPGRATFRPDPAAPIRHRLMQIYYAQRAFFEKHNRWATTLAELNLPDALAMPGQMTTLSPTPNGYEAAISVKGSGGNSDKWTVRQDSRLEHRPANPPAAAAPSGSK